MKNYIFAVLFFAVIILFFSCSSKQDIDVSENSDITCSLTINLENILVKYIDDLADAAGVDDLSYFDTEYIKTVFSGYEELELETITNVPKNKLFLKFKIKNKNSKLNSDAGKIFNIVSANETKKIIFDFDIEKYKNISQIFKFGENPLLAQLMPYPDNPFSEKEYFELVDYIFEDYSKNVSGIIKNCFANITINVPGKITRVKNGTSTGNKAVFKIPVVKFLTLSEPVLLEVEYN